MLINMSLYKKKKNLNDDFNQDVCTYDVLYISYDMVKHM